MRPYINRFGKVLQAVVAACMVLVSCDRIIYDYEGDCEVTYLVKFRYDYNLKFADAFAHEVETVTLYLLDQEGTVVWQGTESGEKLAAEDYAMEVDVVPGTYDMLAWCGTADKGSFIIPESTDSRELTCTLDRKHDESGAAYKDEDLDRLFHGFVDDVVFEDYSEYGGTYTYTVPLVKDTNHFVIILQHLSYEPINPDSFTFSIVDSNGSMDWDNSLKPDEEITYYAWHTEMASANMDLKPKSGTELGAAVAEITIPRLVVGQKPRLVITDNAKGKDVVNIPLIDFALMVKGHYNKDMDNQEYLDRQDEWQMVFFLDEGNRWVSTRINILSWNIVLSNTTLG